MAAKRKPLGWAKDKIGKKIMRRQFVSKREMREALDAFLESRTDEISKKFGAMSDKSRKK